MEQDPNKIEEASKAFNTLVRNLVKPSRLILSEMTPHKMDGLHAIIGLTGELGELSIATTPENLIEESGDILFYIEYLSNWAQVFNVDGKYSDEDLNAYHETIADEIQAISNEDCPLGKVRIISNALQDLIKKYAIYNQAANDIGIMSIMANLIHHFHALVADVSSLIKMETGMDYGPVEYANAVTAKLMKRYPSGQFTNFDAKERADKQDQ